MAINPTVAIRLAVCLAEQLGFNPCSCQSSQPYLNQHSAFFFNLATDNSGDSFKRSGLLTLTEVGKTQIQKC